MLRALAVLLLWIPLLAQAPALTGLAWIAGCWGASNGGTTYEEQWMKPGGGIMLGMSRTVSGGRAAALEFLSIEPVQGKLAYIARPSGQRQAAFTLVRAAEGEAVFENLEHDFPQRIIYRKTPGGLTARIESADGKKGRDFAMAAAACP